MNKAIPRRCSRCKRKKHYRLFYRDRTQKSGYSSKCKECVAQDRLEKREAWEKHEPATKQCIRCLQVKGALEFHRNVASKDGLGTYCRICQNKAAKRNELKKRYGVTLEQKAAMFWLQEGRCSICQKILGSATNRNVDHNHETKQVRGLLCTSCNFAIGHFYDNGDLLQRAKGYIEYGPGYERARARC